MFTNKSYFKLEPCLLEEVCQNSFMLKRILAFGQLLKFLPLFYFANEVYIKIEIH